MSCSRGFGERLEEHGCPEKLSNEALGHLLWKPSPLQQSGAKEPPVEKNGKHVLNMRRKKDQKMSEGFKNNGKELTHPETVGTRCNISSQKTSNLRSLTG